MIINQHFLSNFRGPNLRLNPRRKYLSDPPLRGYLSDSILGGRLSDRSLTGYPPLKGFLSDSTHSSEPLYSHKASKRKRVIF